MDELAELQNEVEALQERVKKLEAAMEGIFSDMRDRWNEYHNIAWHDRLP